MRYLITILLVISSITVWAQDIHGFSAKEPDKKISIDLDTPQTHISNIENNYSQRKVDLHASDSEQITLDSMGENLLQESKKTLQGAALPGNNLKISEELLLDSSVSKEADHSINNVKEKTVDQTTEALKDQVTDGAEMITDPVDKISLDSGAYASMKAKAKKNVLEDLKSSVYDINLSKIQASDLKGRANEVLSNYNWESLWSEYGVKDRPTKSQLRDELDKYSMDQAELLLCERISGIKLFNNLSPEMFKEREKLKRDIEQLGNTEEQKKGLLKDWSYHPAILNNVQKFFGKGTEERDVENIKSQIRGYRKEDVISRKEYRNIIKEVTSINKEESEAVKKIEENKYFREMVANPDDYFSNWDKNLASDAKDQISQDKFYNKVNQQLNYEPVQALYDNEYLKGEWEKINTQLGEPSGKVISKEVLEEVDSTGTYTQYLSELKSAKDKDNKEVGKIVVKETEERGLMPRNTYFEGIAGFARGDFSRFNASPNIGFDVTDNLSLGTGLIVENNSNEEAQIQTTLDYKAFAKYECWKDRIFIQSEYVSLIPGMSYLKVREGKYGYQHTLMVGGGFKIKLFKENSITFSMLYNVNKNIQTPTLDVPWLTRLGITVF